MKSVLKKISPTEFNALNLDKCTLKEVTARRERVYMLISNEKVENKNKQTHIENPLIKLEISLRKCERLGVFKKR